MIVIYDASGQTCNRLWSYAPSIARCVIEQKRMSIIFHDETIEDFPAFLHCPFIYFPLWNKHFFSSKNGWKYYNGIIWRVKFKYKKTWDKIGKFLHFTNGWESRSDAKYLQRALPELQKIFRPKEAITQKAEEMISAIRNTADIIVGVHIRRGDYATWHNGRFFYELEDYRQFMLRIQKTFSNQRVSFFISSNEAFSMDFFEGCQCYRFGRGPSGAILDLYTLSLCDKIVGPFSTYSRWASFIGQVPLCFIESKDQQFTADSFSTIVDFLHFENGKEIYDW